jgi:hypothetical protein
MWVSKGGGLGMFFEMEELNQSRKAVKGMGILCSRTFRRLILLYRGSIVGGGACVVVAGSVWIIYH